MSPGRPRAKAAPARIPAATRTMKRVLQDCLKAGGAVMRRYFGNVRFRYKGVQNLITRADTGSQEAILSRIERSFPGHDFVAEESEVKLTGADFVWVVDPLDGTTNFAHGMPLCCVSVALLRRNRVILGGIYDPFADEMFLAERGRGATLNGKPMKVSSVRTLSEALLVTGFPYDRRRKARFYANFLTEFMRRCHGIRRTGSAALDMAWVAAGRLDGFWEFRLNPWDVAAGKLLVEEAGGKVTGFDGRPWLEMKAYGAQTLATNGRVHGEMLKIFRRSLRGRR